MTVLKNVEAVLADPVVKAALNTVAPGIAVGIQVVGAVVDGLFRGWGSPSAKEVVKVMDQQLAEYIKELSSTQSKVYRRELEIRIHTILGVLNEWDKQR